MKNYLRLIAICFICIISLYNISFIISFKKANSSFKNISFSYESKLIALKEIDITNIKLEDWQEISEIGGKYEAELGDKHFVYSAYRDYYKYDFLFLKLN